MALTLTSWHRPWHGFDVLHHAKASQECLGGALDKVGRHVSWAGVWQPRHGSMCSAARKGQRMSTDRGLLRGQLHGLVRGQFGWQIVRMVLAVRAGRLCSWCWQIVQAVGLHDAQRTRAGCWQIGWTWQFT
ncbi:unnamed protein product [Prunus armeniaca]